MSAIEPVDERPPYDLPTGESKTKLVRSMFDTIAPRYNIVNRMMTLGLDRRWREGMVKGLALPFGATVLDLACGTGDLTVICHKLGYKVIGADSSSGMLLSNKASAPLVLADSCSLPLGDASVDGVVCGYALRNFTDLENSLIEAGRIVRPGGRVSILEIASPTAAVVRLGFNVWFRHLVPLIGGVMSDRSAYEYLPKSTAYLPDTPTLRSLLLQAGFSAINHRYLSGGLSQILTATKSGTP
ncbi:MAG: ubiquinone/menaquinone biosynthesis methyltransferase [Acidimicrobiales bacterium]